MNVYEEVGALLLRETGVTVTKWRTSNTGAAATRSAGWEIEAPHPRGPISFGVFSHEVAHQMLHRSGSKQRWLEEIEAEEWALAQFERFGLAGRADYEARAAAHLAYAFYKAIRQSARLAGVIAAEHPGWWARARAARDYGAELLARVAA